MNTNVTGYSYTVVQRGKKRTDSIKAVVIGNTQYFTINDWYTQNDRLWNKVI